MGRGLLGPVRLLPVALGLLLTSPPLAAQQTLRGRVLDANDRPVAGALVVLHGLTDRGGAEFARDQADASGDFTLLVPEADGTTFFAATRIDGDLFVGPVFQQEAPDPYVLRAGAGVRPFPLPDRAQVPSTRETARASSHGGWWVALLAALLLGVVALLALRGRYRPSHARELMVEIARLDLAHGTGPQDNRDAAARSYRTRRATLRRQLDEAIATGSDAADL